jgi:predicted RNA-binding protein with PIN domain
MFQIGSGFVKSTYLIDGHNLLYALRPRFAAELVDGHPGTAAREALVAQLVAAFTRPGQVVRVYFDGGEAHAEQRSAQVEVIYPGGQGDQRADHAILAALPQRGQIPSGALVVVTRDIKLAKRARRRGATVIDPAAFFAECDAGLIP